MNRRNIKTNKVGIVKDILQSMGFKSEAVFDASIEQKNTAFEAANPGLTAEAIGNQVIRIAQRA